MSDRVLLKWGGISAHVSVVLLIISIVTFWVTGGLEFRAWVPLFSTFACFLLVATLATYDCLARSQYPLARAGLGFAALSILTFFLEAAVWGADRMVLRVVDTAAADGLTPLLAVFNSLHMMVLWFIAIWMALWGIGFLRVPGKGRLAGTFMVLVAGFHMVDYLLARLGRTGLPVELWHLGSQVMLLSALTTLGLLLVEASRETNG
jgi:hypothetical protein